MFKFNPAALLKKRVLVPIIVGVLGVFGLTLPPEAVDGLAVVLGVFI
tara:strand:- start:497 stop:637 length:141 start_codon:yes stop_codon:yes gene_type:complete